MQNSFVQKYSTLIAGTISCYDRVVLKGDLPSISHAGAMTNLLYRRAFLLKDYKQFVSPFRNDLHARAKRISTQENVPIIVIRQLKKVRKEDLVKEQIQKRGDHAGLVCILSAQERCQNYVYRYDKLTGRSYLQSKAGKCTHYYYYFIDKDLGLCYLRIPTWCPFKLQFYFNGHNWLARCLDRANIRYEMQDNAFVEISDFEKAQAISDRLSVRQVHNLLDAYVDLYCPVPSAISHTGYRWHMAQMEYATDVIFKDQKKLAPIYDEILKTMMHTVTPDDVARFLARKDLHGRNNLPLDTSYKQVRHEMRRIKHNMGSASIKIYDKFSKVLRIETTTYNVSEFRHYRTVEHRDGNKSQKLAPVKKSIYAMKALTPILLQCNLRYLKHIAAFDAPNSGKKRLKKLTNTTTLNNRTYKGFNIFDQDDEHLLRCLAKGDFLIKGLRNKDLRELIPDKNTGQISRIIKRLVVRGLLRKVKKTYRYFLTALGYKIIATALNAKQLLGRNILNYS